MKTPNECDMSERYLARSLEGLGRLRIRWRLEMVRAAVCDWHLVGSAPPPPANGIPSCTTTTTTTGGRGWFYTFFVLPFIILLEFFISTQPPRHHRVGWEGRRSATIHMGMCVCVYTYIYIYIMCPPARREIWQAMIATFC